MENNTTFGENLKITRSQMGLSLSEVSSRTGVSKAMLSQIERSESMPTIATAWKIANGLKVKLDTLMGNSHSLYELQDIKDMTPVSDENGKMLCYSVFPFSPMSGYEGFYGIFKPGCNYCDGSNHERSSTEQLFISQGELEVVINDQSYIVKAGCSLSFDAQEKHTYINSTEEDATALIVVHYK